MASTAAVALLLAFAVGAAAQETPSPAVMPAPAIDTDLLTGTEDKQPVRNADQNPYEFAAYRHLLTQAHHTSQQSLALGARHDLTYAHLFEEAAKYRGQVVHLQGRLRRLRQFDAPTAVHAEGIPVIYEGWIFDELYYANPFCVLLTDLPSNLAVGENIEHRVSFDGYVFKRYRYKAGDGWRDCPLLIGHTLVVAAPPPVAPESSWSFSQAFLPSFLGLILGTALLAVGLGWWYRRGDRQVRARLAGRQAAAFVEPEPGSEPLSFRSPDTASSHFPLEADERRAPNSHTHEEPGLYN